MSKNLQLAKVDFGLRRNIFILIFFLFFILRPAWVHASPNTDTMLGYWKLDGNVSDASGDGCMGVLANGPVYSASVPSTQFPDSQSLQFDGVDDLVNSFSNPTNLRPTAGLTFSAWVYLNAFPTLNGVIGGNYELGYTNGFHLQIDQSNNQVYFEVGNGSTYGRAVFSLTSISVGSWHHIAGTWDGSIVRIFLDGTNVASTAFSGPVSYSSPSGTVFELGRNVNGKIDDVRLYSRALGASSEIADLAAGHHTTATWTGTSTNYDSASNWSPAAVPDPYTHVIIDSTFATAFPVLTSSEYAASLDISSASSSLDIGSYNFSINDSGSFLNNGTLLLQNTGIQSLNGFANDTNSGTVIVTGTSAATGLATGDTYNNLTIRGTGAFTLANNLTVNGNLTFENGTLDVSASDFGVIVKGNWQNTGGTFTPRNGTVYLSGTGQSVTGSNTFYNLNKSVSTTDTLTFSAGAIQTVTGHLLLQGAGSISQFLSLRSSTSGTQWKIDPQGTRDISGVDVKDSSNINSTPISLTGTNINSGNNTNWTFSAASAYPSIALSSFSSPTSSTRPSAKGSATGLNANISSVQFQIDSASGSWEECTADDGTFGGLTENFTCRPAAALSEGNHTMYIRATDSSSNTTPSASYSVIAFEIDTTSPDVTSVSDDHDSDSAKITWNTDENSDSRVEFGKSSSYGHVSTESDRVKDHSVTISNLDSCTEYHYQVSSEDKAGNRGKSSDHNFKTDGCATSSDTSTSSATSSTEATNTASPTETTATTNTTNPIQTTSENVASSSTVPQAAVSPDFNGPTSQDWQLKYFGNAICLDAAKCGADADPDGDGVPNGEEYRLGTNPISSDSDNDGMTDAAEIESGHNPLKSSQSPSGDSITYENAKESGKVDKDKYKVENVEMVGSQGTKKLKISGKGPPDKFVTIFVYSDPIVLTVKTDSDGNWSYVLDQDIDDGQHEVYVAVTDNAGRISEKSDPLFFAKTAEAVTLIPPAEAAAAERAESPTEVWYKNGIYFIIFIVVIGLSLALASIGIYKYRQNKKGENIVMQENF